MISDQISNYAVKQGIPFLNNYNTSEKETNKKAVDMFLAIRTGEVESKYLYSVYNITNNQKVAQVFLAGSYLVKASNGEVIEWYQANYQGKDYVSFGLGDTPIEYYVLKTPSSFIKFDSVTNLEIVESTIGGVSSMPLDKQEILKDFTYKNNIFVWSNKSYGFIVEYVE